MILDRVMHRPGSSGRGSFVLYLMQQAQRVHFNPALNHAIHLSNTRRQPLIIVFQLMSGVPDSNSRHYTFMLQGISEVMADLRAHGLHFFVVFRDHAVIMSRLCSSASAVVNDVGYLRWQREYLNDVDSICKHADRYLVEADVVVPVGLASPKEEYSAATFRRRVLPWIDLMIDDQKLPEYQGHQAPYPSFLARAVRNGSVLDNSGDVSFQLLELKMMEFLPEIPHLAPVNTSNGGHRAASEKLSHFISSRLPVYEEKRNDPSLDIQSGLSPHLHFGQISPVEIILNTLQALGIETYQVSHLINSKANPEPLQRSAGAFFEELIIRRELSCNFCFYNPQYDTYGSIAQWAKNTLANHARDARSPEYSITRMEDADTHDKYWNAAQTEVRITGKMHNYMRMYWGKKIIEWTRDPEFAYDIMLHLNNKYELDGRDPNGYAGVAWCFGKHDRPWQERPIFGKVRYMNAAGLARKFNIDAYVDKVRSL